MALLVCALLFVRTLGRLDAVDLGFDPDHLLIAQFNTGNVPRGEALATRASDLERRLQSVPGVASAAIVTATPFGDAGGGSRIQLPGYTRAPADPYFTQTTVVGSGFFRTSGIHLLRGRDFAVSDAAPGPDRSGAPARVAIVNEAFVRKFAGTKDALSLRFSMSRATYEVIGVAHDARYDDVRHAVAPLIYFPVAQNTSRLRRLAILVRFNGPMTALATLTAAIRTETQKTGDLRVTRIATLRELIDRSFDEERLAATVSSAAGSLAMLLVSVGLLGTVAYTATRRTRELGIRAALGGRRWAIIGMLIREILALVIVGIAVGVPLAIATARLLSSKLFGVGAADPLSLAVAAVLMVMVGIAASVVPAYRAAGIHPLAALRHD